MIAAGILGTALTSGFGYPRTAQTPLPEFSETTVEGSREQALDAYYRGEPEQALAKYLTIIERDPEDRDAREQTIWLLRELGRPEEALWHANRLVEHHSGDDFIRLQAVVAALANEHEQAREAPTAMGSNGPAAEVQFYVGLSAFVAGEYETGEELLEKSRSDRSLRAQAKWVLSRIAESRGEYERGVELLEKARREEPNLTASLIPLAEALLALDDTEHAHDILNRAELSLPLSDTARRLNAELVAEHPELKTAQVERREQRIAELDPQPATEMAPARETIPQVRIGLAENLEYMDMKTSGPFVVVGEDGEPMARGSGGTVVRLAWQGPELKLSLEYDGRVTPIVGSEPLRIEYLDPDATTAIFEFAFGSGQYSAGREDRRYRGSLEIFPTAGGNGITVVNEVNVEEYLYSVVPSEMPSSWPMEALKAQAVAARSYTLAGLGRFADQGFDLFGSVRSAFYRGVEGESSRAVEAVRSTQGKVLMAGDRPLNAVYSANAGGHTEDARIVWGSDSTLVGVADPATIRWREDRLEQRHETIATDRHGLPQRGEAALPPAALQEWLRTRPESFSGSRFASYHAYRWRLLVAREEIEQRLEANDEGIGSLQAVIPRGRGEGGRVKEVELRGSEGRRTLSGDRIRHRLGGLRSTLFVVDPIYNDAGEPEFFLFAGGGWGHGVGMCQTGAAAMGEIGYPYQAILAHYYPRARLEARYPAQNP